MILLVIAAIMLHASVGLNWGGAQYTFRLSD